MLGVAMKRVSPKLREDEIEFLKKLSNSSFRLGGGSFLLVFIYQGLRLKPFANKS